jgi:hypothetical protein
MLHRMVCKDVTHVAVETSVAMELIDIMRGGERCGDEMCVVRGWGEYTCIGAEEGTLPGTKDMGLLRALGDSGDSGDPGGLHMAFDPGKRVGDARHMNRRALGVFMF